MPGCLKTRCNTCSPGVWRTDCSLSKTIKKGSPQTSRHLTSPGRGDPSRGKLLGLRAPKRRATFPCPRWVHRTDKEEGEKSFGDVNAAAEKNSGGRSEEFHAREQQTVPVRAKVEGDLFRSARSFFFFFKKIFLSSFLFLLLSPRVVP